MTAPKLQRFVATGLIPQTPFPFDERVMFLAEKLGVELPERFDVGVVASLQEFWARMGVAMFKQHPIYKAGFKKRRGRKAKNKTPKASKTKGGTADSKNKMPAKFVRIDGMAKRRYRAKKAA